MPMRSPYLSVPLIYLHLHNTLTPSPPILKSTRPDCTDLSERRSLTFKALFRSAIKNFHFVQSCVITALSVLRSSAYSLIVLQSDSSVSTGCHSDQLNFS